MKNIIQKKKLKEFGVILGIGIPLFWGFLIPLIFGHYFKLWTFYLGLLFLLLGFIKPNLLNIPYKIWMKLGLYLGWINSRIILSIIFFVILLPISLIMKCFKYDPLKIKKRNLKTFREKRYSSNIDLKRIF